MTKTPEPEPNPTNPLSTPHPHGHPIQPPLTKIQKTAAIFGCAACLAVAASSIIILISLYITVQMNTWSGTTRDLYILYFMFTAHILLFLYGARSFLSAWLTARQATIITMVTGAAILILNVLDVARSPVPTLPTLLLYAVDDNSTPEFLIISYLALYFIPLISILVLRKHQPAKTNSTPSAAT